MWHLTSVTICLEKDRYMGGGGGEGRGGGMYMTYPIFLDWYMKGPTFSDFPAYAQIFHSENFEAACSLGIQ